MVDRIKRYDLTQSPFYRLQSREKLAAILHVNIKELHGLRQAKENFIRFTTDSGREVQWPKPRLRRIHKRAAKLLSRIQVPDYLHSAIRGRSYLTNARAHSFNAPCVKVDIKQFFQRIRAQSVYHFFLDKMQCAPDVAGILTRLLTVDQHLPTGGNVSPILSYFSYMDMFSEINDLSNSRNCVMTCLMDDMTFTGQGASPELIGEVRKIVGRYRLRAHKTKFFNPSQPRVITGVAITSVGYRAPNKLQAAIANDRKLLTHAKSDEERLEFLQRAIGRLQAAAQIEPQWRQEVDRLVAQRREIKQRAISGTLVLAGQPSN